ncbi:MAG: DEAD/DEAH box helicase, partial [Planctomycetales bacterium]
MALSAFHPIIQEWFRGKFAAPTDAQRLGWPSIRARKNTLIAAPTGSGKTLAAFLLGMDELLREGIDGSLADQTSVIYVSPLKALGNDVRRNLELPLREIRELAESQGISLPEIRSAVRTGDTPSSQRQAMVRRPPHILVTTPESLYLLLTSPKARNMLRSARTVIVDEIHALARDKRGSHLSLSLERLEALCETPPLRIGLSATQKPIEEIAQFLVGVREPSGSAVREPGELGSEARNGSQEDSACEIIDAGHLRELDLAVVTPPSELSAVCSNETWDEI